LDRLCIISDYPFACRFPDTLTSLG